MSYDSWKTRDDRPEDEPVEHDPEAERADAEDAMIQFIEHENFSHTRRGNGCWRDVVWVYHRDPASPSGVRLAASGHVDLVEPLLKQAAKSGPMAPYPKS